MMKALKGSSLSPAKDSSCSVSRPPLNTIQDPSNHDGGPSEKTPAKPSSKGKKLADATTPLPLQRNNGVAATNWFSLGRNSEYGGVVNGGFNEEEEGRDECNDQLLVQSSRGVSGNGGFPMMTPPGSVSRVKYSSCYAENNSTQNTPAKSVIKPRSRGDGSVGGGRALGSVGGHSKGVPITCCPSNVEVPHFDLKEGASSFWMENNVQVLIRIRPLSSMEKSIHGFNRCLRQESGQTVSWIGKPETRFTFDNVACETVDQGMLFRTAGLPMIENCLSGYNSCIFAYGQTGSGKTYTMLGDIDNLEVRPSSNRGLMPRIFDFLFARIQAEEELRRDERLQYNCKCSFLEIYNEQITDLLDPSSSNLLVREDMTKGVYVENLSEFEVHAVGDILKLLLQGSLNRKVAATNMNKESSRSHSVFTCVIESRWENDSTNNMRFARLNLVDLAGSERQKTSGAEGARLKEAANINKSLSTLGHVIMVLMDVAQGKPKHIPYRDSRLTFLLQDSLGGNSKTMIIANVSPSIGCAAETLNTLKFAQRAKFIQKRAVVNEDSSGDVTTLQHQICLLKEELSILKRQNISRSLSFGQPIMEDISLMVKDEQHDDDQIGSESRGIVRVSSKQFKSLERTLAGSLRREHMVESSIKQLEAEIEQLKRLVRQREEDTRCTKMTLRFREDKINRMESLLGGSIPADTYLLLENTALTKENELLQTKVDRNPEVTRFALENMRLLEQLRRFQDFYEEGEREILLDELSQLRDQLLKCFDGNSEQQSHQNFKMVSQEVHVTNERDSLQFELDKTLRELADCRSKLSTCLEVNENLTREMHELRSLMNNLTSAPVDQNNNFNIIKDSLVSPALAPHLPKAVQNKRMEEKHESLTNHMDEIVNLQLELDILKLIVKEERSSRSEAEEKIRSLNKDLDQENKKAHLIRKECGDLKHELDDAKSIIDALESQQIILINKMEDLENISNRNEELLSEKELELRVMKEQMITQQLRDQSPLQAKLKRTQDSLETAKKLDMLYQTDRAFQKSNEEQMDEIGRQAEAETAEVIVCLQEELSTLAQEVQDSNLKEMETRKLVTCLQTHLKELEEQICLLTQKLVDKDLELTTVSQGWELLTGEIEELLVDGHEEILDASAQLDLVADSFLEKRSWVSGQFGKMIRLISEKEQLIRELKRYLDDSNKRIAEVESMLRSLRAAALAITEAHQQELTVKDTTISLLTGQLSEGKSILENLENKIAHGEDQLRKVSACATAAFVTVNRLHETNLNKSDVIKHTDSLLCESTEMNKQKDSRLRDQVIVVEEAERQIQLLRKELEVSAESCCSLRLMLDEELKKNQLMVLTLSSCNTTKSLNSVESLYRLSSSISNKLVNITIVDKLFQEFDDITELAFKFIEELDLLGNIARDMSSKNLSLQTELCRKDDITEGLLLDLSLLRESAANSNYQKDEIQEMMASLEALKNELLVKSNELDEAVCFGHTLEGQLKEKIGMISTLELELSQKCESVKFLSNENIELRTCIEDLSAAKTSIEDNLTEKISAINGLERELVQFGDAFGEMNASVDTMKKSVTELSYERDQLQMDVLHLKGKLDLAKADADAEANEAIAVEAQQIAESSNLYAGAANSNYQKDEIQERMASLEALKNELLVKSNELDEAVSFGHTLEGQLKEKIGMISTLELELSKKCESVKFLSNENIELKTCIEDLSAAKTSIEDNLTEKISAINGLERELVQFGDAFGEMNASVDTLKKSVTELSYERDQLQMDVLHLKGKLDLAKADAEANEAIAVEAQQIAESSNLYAGEKEEEVKLLEKSVEELENTVDVLENKVDIVKGEAKRQRLQREELELELHAVRHQLQNVQSRDDYMQSHLDEKEIGLREALKRVQILETDITDREAEISKLKSHISELNLHAEAQACEYKQKFKALEGMVEQVKLDSCLNHVTNSSSNKPEKNVSKPRGSGSPFKCMGLGLVQQMKSEKDEELTVAKIRIEELEALAVSRQKEIFMLNSRLASAESMTHDVLRDLLEVKLDMTKYASFLDNDEMHKISNNAQVPCTESLVKEEEISRLKQQLSEFIEERAGWVEEIDRKHAELVTAQLALDKLRQQVQFLKDENGTFKMENVDHRKKVMDLEGEMKRLSGGQQNFQQRIHHHAKIKEENNQLRIQNENLINKLRRLDGTLSRVK